MAVFKWETQNAGLTELGWPFHLHSSHPVFSFKYFGVFLWHVHIPCSNTFIGECLVSSTGSYSWGHSSLCCWHWDAPFLRALYLLILAPQNLLRNLQHRRFSINACWIADFGNVDMSFQVRFGGEGVLSSYFIISLLDQRYSFQRFQKERKMLRDLRKPCGRF